MSEDPRSFNSRIEKLESASKQNKSDVQVSIKEIKKAFGQIKTIQRTFQRTERFVTILAGLGLGASGGLSVQNLSKTYNAEMKSLRSELKNLGAEDLFQGKMSRLNFAVSNPLKLLSTGMFAASFALSIASYVADLVEQYQTEQRERDIQAVKQEMRKAWIADIDNKLKLTNKKLNGSVSR